MIAFRPWLQRLLQSAGAAGVLAIGVFLFCLPFYFSAVQPAERELQVRRAETQRAPTRSAYRPVAADVRAEELLRFYALFPPLTQLSRQLDRIYGLAREAKLEPLQAEYRLDKRGDGLVAYRILLPLRGGYAEVRRFLAAALQSVPNASIDALRFERKSAEESELDAQVQLTVYFRPDSEGGAQ